MKASCIVLSAAGACAATTAMAQQYSSRVIRYVVSDCAASAIYLLARVVA
jgi:hypothetical protein